MKTGISVALAAHYAGDRHTLARLWLITRRDGEVYGFTDHDQAIDYASQRYTPGGAFDASSIETRGELNVDNAELLGLLDADGITAQDIEAGLWDGATVTLREVNYADLSMGHNTLRHGSLGELQRSGPRYTAELRGLMHRLQNIIGRLVTPGCDADLGDARCGVDLSDSTLDFAGVVSTAASARQFSTASAAITGEAAGYFDHGTVEWVDGLNAGRRMEVKQHTLAGSATLLLQLPMPYAIGDADAFILTPGCDKTKATCIAKFDNVVNFRGFSFVPGQDKVLLVGGQQ